MRTKYAFIALGVLALAISVDAVYKVCATDKYISECTQLQRGNSEVLCQWVQDSIECAERIRNGTADFGRFSAESVGQLGLLGWTDLTVIKELRHKSRQEASVDFEVVVIVRSNHSSGLLGLKGKGYCHRGFYYGKAYRWSEQFLKFFERAVVPYSCNASSMPEVEASSVSRFFGKACRPGIWSHDRVENAELQAKYSNLCELCDNKSSCSYNSDDVSEIFQCLGQGENVAFVSLQEAKQFGARNNESNQYSYLCPDGTTQPLKNNSSPCSWIKEPWDVIISGADRAIDMQKSIEGWIAKSYSPNTWQATLFSILVPNNYQIVQTTIQSPADLMQSIGRGVAPRPICNRSLYWCTVSTQEKDKCDVARAGAITSGIQPAIDCLEPADDTVDCINAISQGRADFMGIDSNYGFLARNLYNLTAALYFETEMDQYSSVVTVVREGSKFKSFESLKGARACIPEFGGTASVAFVNVGKSRGFLDRKECRYGLLMSSFFSDSCAPGARDFRHQRTTNLAESLCTLCKAAPTTEEPQQYLTRSGSMVNITGTPATPRDECEADNENPYYGNFGALRCLSEAGDVAIVELQSLSEHAKNLNISENDFRIICRNGSLASNTGFNVDLDCALTTIVDGEVVVRRGSSKINSIINALSAMDSYFQTNPDFKMYNIFDSTRHLLFKDSTIGLIGYNEEDLPPRVLNYKKLFEYIESCKQGNSATSVSVNGVISTILALVVSLYLAL